jgi:carboxylate-amine ligase
MFRAARFGVQARLPDGDGRLRPVSELMDEAVTRLGSLAAELKCSAEVASLPDLLRRGGGAGLQRDRYEIAGLDAVLRELTQLTANTDGRAGDQDG